MQGAQGGSMVVLLLLLPPLTSSHLAPSPSFGHHQPIDHRYSHHQGYGQEHSSMMVEMVRAATSTAMDMVVESGAMQVAIVMAAIAFIQTSVLNYTYFLTTALPLLGIQLG